MLKTKTLDTLERSSVEDIVILDTETTGLGAGTEILELCLYAATGEVLLNQRFKPMWTHSWEGAEAIHGISPEAVADKETLFDNLLNIRKILKRKTVVIYNASYDTALFPDRLSSAKHVICAMNAYKLACGHTKYSKLVDAAKAADHEWVETPHTALGDCKATLSVVIKTLRIMQEARNALNNL